MKESILYCGQLDNGDFFNFYCTPALVQLAGYDEIFKVKVTESELIPDTSKVDKSNEDDDYFAWWEEKEKEFMFVGRSIHLVTICFTSGTKVEFDKGRGNVYKVNVEVLETVGSQDESR